MYNYIKSENFIIMKKPQLILKKKHFFLKKVATRGVQIARCGRPPQLLKNKIQILGSQGE